jgi:hypothetical protein
LPQALPHDQPIESRREGASSQAVVHPPAQAAEPHQKDIGRIETSGDKQNVSVSGMAENTTIDEQYNSLADKECGRGIAALVCRESLKLKLCDGKWAESPPLGQSLCKQVTSQATNG